MKRPAPEIYLAFTFWLAWWGPVVYAAQVEVGVSTGSRYDSNIFRSTTAPERDVSFSLTPEIALKSRLMRVSSRIAVAQHVSGEASYVLFPGLALRLPFNKAYFGLDSSAVLGKRVTRIDTNHPKLTFSGLGRFNLSDRLSFELRDDFIISEPFRSFYRLTDSPRAQTSGLRSGTIVTQQREPVENEPPSFRTTDSLESREFMDNRFSSTLRSALKAGWTSLGYTNTVRNQRDSPSAEKRGLGAGTIAERGDWIAHTGQLQVGYPLGAKTSMRVGLGLGRKMYEADIDYVSVPLTIGLQRQLTHKLGAGLSVGLERRWYNEDYRSSNVSQPTVRANITRKLTAKTASRLGLHRVVYDSDFAIGDAYVSAGGDVALILNPGGAMLLILGGLYSRNSYIQHSRLDHLFEGRGAVQYQFKWGAVVLRYDYERRTSSVPNQAYRRHVLDLSYRLF